MGQEYSMEVVERAEELYCIDGQTFDAVATLTGVAASTLKRWSERYCWQEKKEEIRLAMSGIRLNKIKLRAKLIENCLTTLNAQDAFAVSAIEGLALRTEDRKGGRLSAPTVMPDGSPLREIKTDDDALAALEEAVQIKINLMLANPGQITGAAIKEISQIRSTLDDLKKKSAQADDSSVKTTKLDKETLKRVREQIYGVA